LKSIKIRSPVVSLKKARNCGKNKKKEVFSRTMQAGTSASYPFSGL
jgi:hypothetical protein